MNKTCEQRSPRRPAGGPSLLSPFLISPLTPPLPSSLNMTFDLAASTEARIALYSYYRCRWVLFFFLHDKEKKLPKCIESAKTLDAKSVRRPPPIPNRSPPVVLVFFDTLDNKKCFIFMILPDLLLDRVSLCTCVCACLSGRSWRNENVSSRATVYLCGYLFE